MNKNSPRRPDPASIDITMFSQDTATFDSRMKKGRQSIKSQDYDAIGVDYPTYATASPTGGIRKQSDSELDSPIHVISGQDTL